jgi:hypothetical protein
MNFYIFEDDVDRLFFLGSIRSGKDNRIGENPIQFKK